MLVFHLDSSAKIDRVMSDLIQQAIANNSGSIQIVCDKGGESLTKEVLTSLNRPDLKKQYRSATRDGKNATCVVVQL